MNTEVQALGTVNRDGGRVHSARRTNPHTGICCATGLSKAADLSRSQGDTESD